LALVVFDLDGTISRRDTLAAYLVGFLAQHRSRWPRVLASVPVLFGAALGLVDRGALKASLMRAVLGGCPRQGLDGWTQSFVTRLLARGVFADARAAIAQHLQQGDELVLMSASPDLYVPEIAHRLGFRQTICTGVLWHGDRFDGALTTPNRRGAEKARCFSELRARHAGLPTVAYANSACDFEHLRLADQAYLVNPSPRLCRQAEALKIRCVNWR
jgi:phosphatidylglycerophosphatase C